MPIPQTKFREVVFQLLYSYDTGYATEKELIELIMAELSVTKTAVRQAAEKVEKIRTRIEEIDKAITDISQSYSFDRIQSVERNILRLGGYELLYDDAIPPKVAIAEAMRLARKFGTPESASFVNAILDNLFKSSKGEETSTSDIQQRLKEMEETERLSKLGHELRLQENQTLSDHEADESS